MEIEVVLEAGATRAWCGRACCQLGTRGHTAEASLPLQLQGFKGWGSGKMHYKSHENALPEMAWNKALVMTTVCSELAGLYKQWGLHGMARGTAVHN